MSTEECKSVQHFCIFSGLENTKLYFLSTQRCSPPYPMKITVYTEDTMHRMESKI